MEAVRVLTREQLIPILDRERAAGRKIVYTSGVFDLLHRGHVAYLEQARSHGDLLVVGVNSDSSVRELKGELRPIVPEAERAAIVAALRCVDYVFIFSEKNNNQNVTLLKPAVYVKAGDYSKEKLSSASIVEAHGGTVAFATFEKGLSSSGIIDTVAARYGSTLIQATPGPEKKRAPAIFLDRDGTLNEHVDYLSKPEQFKLIPGVIDALKMLKSAGYYLVITTNQPGIGMGYFTREDLFAVNRKFLREVSASGVIIDKVYFCPHSDADGCTCRKPRTGMIERACRELPIDLEQSYVVGDMTIDLQFAQNAGVRSILVGTGFGGKDGRYSAEPTIKADSVLDAAKVIVESEPGKK